MTAVLVRDVSPETHRALKARAKKNGRSLSAEIRVTLEKSVALEKTMGLGTAIRQLTKKYAEDLAEIDFDSLRDRSPVRFPDFTSAEFDRPEFE